MLEAGKGLGERSRDIERRTELDFSFFSGHELSSMHLYLYCTRSNPSNVRIECRAPRRLIFHEGRENASVLL